VFRGKKLFWKYLITYLLVSALITFSMFIMLRSMIRLQINGAKAAQQEKLNIVAEAIENRFVQYNEIATLIYLDSAVSPSWIRQSEYNAYEAIQKLKLYRSKCIDIDQIIICVDGDRLYSTKGFYTLDTFINSYCRMSGEGSRVFTDALKSDHAVCCLIESTRDGITMQILYYHCTLPINDTCSSSSVEFIIDLRVMSQELEILLGDNSGYASIALEDGTLLTEIGDIMISETAADQSEFRYKGINYSSQSLTTPRSGFNIRVITNNQQIISSVYRVWRPAFIVLIMLTVVAVALSFLFSSYNYQPIRALYDSVVTLPDGGNELDSIQRVFAITSEEMNHLKSFRDDSRTLIYKQALRMMFEGNERDELAARQMLNFLGMEDIPNWYSVAVVEMTPNAQQQLLDRGAIPLYFLRYNNIDLMCVLLATDNDDTLTESFVEKVCALRLNTEARIGVGQVYDVCGRIRRSMNEALAALDSCATGETVYFSTMTRMHSLEAGIDETLRNGISDAVKGRDRERMLRCLDSFIEYLKDETFAEDIRLFLMYDVVHLVANALVEIGMDRTFRNDLTHVDTGSIVRFEITMQILMNHIADTKDTTEYTDSRFRQIRTYIEQNFCASSLSAERVADQFGITRGHLSRIFKEASGMTYIDFVTGLRIREAKRRLCETQDSIQCILESVGYHDAASFHRKFKQLTGMTPLQYRNNVCKDEAQEEFDNL
jgi:AraC-like DNA-binding protein